MDEHTTITRGLTVADLTERFEGKDFDAYYPEKDHFLCDFCSGGVSYASNPRVGHYVADDVLNKDSSHAQQIHHQRPLTSLATYCPDCTRPRLLFPCEGYAEARLTFTLDDEMVMKDVTVRDVSQRDDGIPWDPRELSEKITGFDFDLQAMYAEQGLWGPENMITFYLSSVDDVDPREVVNWDGTLDPQALGRARNAYQEFRKKMSQHGHSRRAFRDHVRETF